MKVKMEIMNQIKNRSKDMQNFLEWMLTKIMNFYGLLRKG